MIQHQGLWYWKIHIDGWSGDRQTVKLNSTNISGYTVYNIRIYLAIFN